MIRNLSKMYGVDTILLTVLTDVLRCSMNQGLKGQAEACLGSALYFCITDTSLGLSDLWSAWNWFAPFATK